MSEEKNPQTHTCLAVRASEVSQIHPCPYQGRVYGFNGLKFSGTQVILMGMTGKACGSHVAAIKGSCCEFLLIPLH